MSKTKQKPAKFPINKILLYAGIFFASIVIVSIFWMYISSARYAIQSQNYPHAELLYRDSASWQANVQQTNLFYWVSDDIIEVRDYFEKLPVRFFFPQDEYGEWLIARFRSKQRHMIDTNHAYILHNSLCDIRLPEQCITVSLVNVEQPDVWQLSVMSPSSFRYSEPPFEIPATGTLIIYSYAHADY